MTGSIWFPKRGLFKPTVSWVFTVQDFDPSNWGRGVGCAVVPPFALMP